MYKEGVLGQAAKQFALKASKLLQQGRLRQANEAILVSIKCLNLALDQPDLTLTKQMSYKFALIGLLKQWSLDEEGVEVLTSSLLLMENLEASFKFPLLLIKAQSLFAGGFKQAAKKMLAKGEQDALELGLIDWYIEQRRLRLSFLNSPKAILMLGKNSLQVLGKYPHYQNSLKLLWIRLFLTKASQVVDISVVESDLLQLAKESSSTEAQVLLAFYYLLKRRAKLALGLIDPLLLLLLKQQQPVTMDKFFGSTPVILFIKALAYLNSLQMESAKSCFLLAAQGIKDAIYASVSLCTSTKELLEYQQLCQRLDIEIRLKLADLYLMQRDVASCHQILKEVFATCCCCSNKLYDYWTRRIQLQVMQRWAGLLQLVSQVDRSLSFYECLAKQDALSNIAAWSLLQVNIIKTCQDYEKEMGGDLVDEDSVNDQSFQILLGINKAMVQAEITKKKKGLLDLIQQQDLEIDQAVLSLLLLALGQMYHLTDPSNAGKFYRMAWEIRRRMGDAYGSYLIGSLLLSISPEEEEEEEGELKRRVKKYQKSSQAVFEYTLFFPWLKFYDKVSINALGKSEFPFILLQVGRIALVAEKTNDKACEDNQELYFQHLLFFVVLSRNVFKRVSLYEKKCF